MLKAEYDKLHKSKKKTRRSQPPPISEKLGKLPSEANVNRGNEAIIPLTEQVSKR